MWHEKTTSRLKDYTLPQAVNKASPEVSPAYVHIVIILAFSYLFLISIEEKCITKES